MWLHRAAIFLLDHSVKIGLAVLILAGLVWLLAPREEKKEPLKLLEARCTERQLALRRIELKPGSPEEKWFLLAVPRSNRERVGDRHWAFCRAGGVPGIDRPQDRSDRQRDFPSDRR